MSRKDIFTEKKKKYIWDKQSKSLPRSPPPRMRSAWEEKADVVKRIDMKRAMSLPKLCRKLAKPNEVSYNRMTVGKTIGGLTRNAFTATHIEDWITEKPTFCKASNETGRRLCNENRR